MTVVPTKVGTTVAFIAIKQYLYKEQTASTTMNKKGLLLLGTAMMGGAVAAQEKPNIIVVLCDDLGYGDVGCYGQPYIKTPNLDRMAREGMRFTQAYCGCPVSAPSRCSLMTGQHCGHTEVRGNKEYWSGNVKYGNNDDYAVAGQHPYDTTHINIPQIMKEHGYTTGMFGKWAAGHEKSNYTPDKRGIDEYYGYICQFQAHLHYPNFLNRYSKSRGDTATIRVTLDENIKHPMHGDEYKKRPQYAADIIHREAMQWIESQSSENPFFGLFTYTLPHAELAQPDDSLMHYYRTIFKEEKSYGGDRWSRYNPTKEAHAQFAAMVTRLDTYMGEILALLEKKGMSENTLVIFTSDNGPHSEGGADPAFFGKNSELRGIKRSMHEGGIRVPFIAYWKGRIAAGTTDHQCAFYDLMPTFCELAGVKDYEAKYRAKGSTNHFDGISIAPTLLGNNGAQKMHDHLYWEFSGMNSIAVRQGDWKLVVNKGECSLYNLHFDWHEDIDIANLYPEKVEELIDIVHKEHVENPIFPVTLPSKKQ